MSFSLLPDSRCSYSKGLSSSRTCPPGKGHRPPDLEGRRRQKSTGKGKTGKPRISELPGQNNQRANAAESSALMHSANRYKGSRPGKIRLVPLISFIVFLKEGWALGKAQGSFAKGPQDRRKNSFQWEEQEHEVGLDSLRQGKRMLPSPSRRGKRDSARGSQLGSAATHTVT